MSDELWGGGGSGEVAEVKGQQMHSPIFHELQAQKVCFEDFKCFVIFSWAQISVSNGIFCLSQWDDKNLASIAAMVADGNFELSPYVLWNL